MLDDRMSPRVKTKCEKTLPKTLPGAVYIQWNRCGRQGCECAGGKLHGPYYYRFWREGGRLRKAYIKAGDVATVQAACERHRQDMQHQRQLQRGGQHAWRDLLARLREVERDG